MLKVPEWQAVRDQDATRHGFLEQCPFADLPPREEYNIFSKKSSIVSDIDLAGFLRRCGHDRVMWRVPASGGRPAQVVTAPHPPIRGTQWAQRIGSRCKPPHNDSGEYLTRATAHYPAELTWQMIGTLVASLHYDHCSGLTYICLLYTSPSPRDQRGSRMPSSA